MPTRPRMNRAKAIRELCFECMGYQLQLINACQDRACPVWEWRRGPGAPEWTMTLLRRQTRYLPLGRPSQREIGAKSGADVKISDALAAGGGEA